MILFLCRHFWELSCDIGATQPPHTESTLPHPHPSPERRGGGAGAGRGQGFEDLLFMILFLC